MAPFAAFEPFLPAAAAELAGLAGAPLTPAGRPARYQGRAYPFWRRPASAPQRPSPGPENLSISGTGAKIKTGIGTKSPIKDRIPADGKAKARITLILQDAVSLKRIDRFDRFEAGHGEAASYNVYCGFFDTLDALTAPARIGRRKQTEGRRTSSASFYWHRRHRVSGSDLGDDTEPWQDRQKLSYAASSLASRQLLAVLHMAPRLHRITKDETHVRYPSRRNRLGRS
jgi:hypothetical protein